MSSSCGTNGAGTGRRGPKRSLQGYGGIVIGQERGADYFFVEDVMRNGPAETSGVRKADLLLGVDGVVVTGMGFEQVQQLLKGPVGSTLTLSLKDPRSEEFSMAVITRAAGHVSTAAGVPYFTPVDPDATW